MQQAVRTSTNLEKKVFRQQKRSNGKVEVEIATNVRNRKTTDEPWAPKLLLL